MFGGGSKKAANPTSAKAALLIAEKTSKNESLCKSLPLRTRLYGWFICICIGVVVSFFSSSMISTISSGRIGLIKFTVLYAIGTCCAFGSSLFLWGPVKQCKSMFDKTRWIATCLYLGSITLIIVFIVLKFTIYPDLPTAILLLLMLI